MRGRSGLAGSERERERVSLEKGLAGVSEMASPFSDCGNGDWVRVNSLVLLRPLWAESLGFCICM